MLVYVVGFQPTSDAAAVGGFDWFPADRHGEAVQRMIRLLCEKDDYHSLTFVPLEIPGDHLTQDEVTRWIDENLHLVEVGR